MPAPLYLTPEYITYEMVEIMLRPMDITITTNEFDTNGIYRGVIENLIALSEQQVCTDILSNFIKLPLENIRGGDFASLYDIPEYRNTYLNIRNMLVQFSLWNILNQYYSVSGTGNGQQLIDNAIKSYNYYKNMYQKLNQAGNLATVNAFTGLVLANNAQNRQPHAGIVPDIFSGEVQSDMAIRSLPDFMTGFNR